MEDHFKIVQLEIPEEEYQKTLRNCFASLKPLRLEQIPAKEKKKLIIISHIAKQFDNGRDYSEKEINAILKEIYPHDYTILRRYLVDYHFLDREPNGSRYWLRD